MPTIITENDESEWDDRTGESYHFPKRYLKFLNPNTKIIYYKGKLKSKGYSEQRLSNDPHYFGIATIGKSYPDPQSTKQDYFCEILDYKQFKKPILAKNDNGYLEIIPESRQSNYWRDGVREVSEEVYENILSHADIDKPKPPFKAPPPLYEDFESNDMEGGKKLRYTSFYERSTKNRTKAIENHGYDCMACGFNFEKTYGEHGRNFIHVHHVVPISNFNQKTEINPEKDLIVLCPNCHAMVHRNKNHTLSLEDLKSLLQSNK